MTLAISLDLETLSTNKNAVVLTIGAATVSPTEGVGKSTFSVALCAQAQIDEGLHVSFETLRWWMRQSNEAKREAFEVPHVHPVVGLEMFRGWLASHGYPPVWSKGPHFDGAILDSLCEAFGVEAVIPYRNHRDIRTIEEAFQSYVKDERVLERFWSMRERAYRETVEHDAVQDAIAQGKVVEFWIKELSGTPG